jgi:hypothetical protein
MPVLAAEAQQYPRPFTQEQIASMVRAGLGDDSGSKLIEQRGIDFAPSEDFYQTLKAAGASPLIKVSQRSANPEHAENRVSAPFEHQSISGGKT